MPGVRSAAVAHQYVRLLYIEVHDLAFAFIAPLGTHYYHGRQGIIIYVQFIKLYEHIIYCSDLWHHGYATEAARACRNFGFREYDMNKNLYDNPGWHLLSPGLLWRVIVLPLMIAGKGYNR
ncbi:MAG: hypothetical protein A4E49_00428 [Methanosaeta sp. PtaU1.Bin112]|nr:MAG: hypothetical protein A4E49_00428 [Methanosaeta sp. PtaU1.Bin112]